VDDERKRAIERVNKLLRLAAPSSGTTEAERTNAALQAAKIFSENNLTAIYEEPKRKRRPQPHASREYHPRSVYRNPVTYAPKVYAQHGANWTAVELDVDCPCVVCGNTLYAGEAAFYSQNHGYRCFDITCST